MNILKLCPPECLRAKDFGPANKIKQKLSEDLRFLACKLQNQTDPDLGLNAVQCQQNLNCLTVGH